MVLIDVNYPTDRNWLGMRLARCWQHFGDILRDVGRLLEEHGFDHKETEIGGFGSIHMYICHRR